MTTYRLYTDVRCWTESDDDGAPKYHGTRCNAVVKRKDFDGHLATAHPLHRATQTNFHALCPTCGREAAQGGMRMASHTRVFCCRPPSQEADGHWFE